jgi:hypothetical protein
MSERYEVGYRRPPKHTRFPKGRSGNPAGRRKGSRNLKTDLHEELNTKVSITENGRRKTVTKQQFLIKRLTNDAMQGNQKASSTVLGLVAHFERTADFGPDPLPTKNDEQILRRFIERARRHKKGERQ